MYRRATATAGHLIELPLMENGLNSRLVVITLQSQCTPIVHTPVYSDIIMPYVEFPILIVAYAFTEFTDNKDENIYKNNCF